MELRGEEVHTILCFHRRDENSVRVWNVVDGNWREDLTKRRVLDERIGSDDVVVPVESCGACGKPIQDLWGSRCGAEHAG